MTRCEQCGTLTENAQLTLCPYCSVLLCSEGCQKRHEKVCAGR